MKRLVINFCFAAAFMLGTVTMTTSCVVHHGHYGQHYKKSHKKMPPGQVKKHYGIHPKHQKKGRW